MLTKLLGFLSARAGATAGRGDTGRPFPSGTLAQLGAATGSEQGWRSREWATEDEAAEALGGDVAVLRRLVADGTLPSYDIDGRTLIPTRDLAFVIAQRSRRRDR